MFLSLSLPNALRLALGHETLRLLRRRGTSLLRIVVFPLERRERPTARRLEEGIHPRLHARFGSLLQSLEAPHDAFFCKRLLMHKEIDGALHVNRAELRVCTGCRENLARIMPGRKRESHRLTGYHTCMYIRVRDIHVS